MLLGATGSLTESSTGASLHMLRSAGGAVDRAAILRESWGVATLDAGDLAAQDMATGSWLYLTGNPLLAKLAPGCGRATTLLEALEGQGLQAALAGVEGAFALVWWSARLGRLFLVRDRFGTEPFFYALRGHDLVFGSRIRDFCRFDGRGFELCPQGLLEFLSYCFLPGQRTLDRDVWRVPPGGVICFDPSSGRLQVERWYRLSFRDPLGGSEREIADAYRERLEHAVQRRIGDDAQAGAFLSGGMDSSSVVTFMRRHLPGEVRTFGFRCGGASFDESTYARSLAAELGTVHREVEYGEPESLSVLEAIEHMEVPFCDIGIEVGTWILARSATQDVGYLLTGDGGDELWASHPVYAAQRLIRTYDRAPIPRFVKQGLQTLTNLVHDSDRKRSLAVVAKRLLPAADLPRALGPFRWRTYYTKRQLGQLLVPHYAAEVGHSDPYACVLEAYRGYDGPDDGISPHLYNDYTTASSFYFSRLLLARSFGIETRTPFYDRELVEYGARIPAHLKLEGVERTKRLFRLAMEGVLPDVINHRKDKLGHSVPLKNWLRADGPLGQRVRDALRDPRSALTGVLRTDLLDRWIGEHQSRRHNHSHRLWAAFVLDAWIRSRIAREQRPRLAA
jgi:asparagine synthase (glutamine-hydrolysing)